MGGNEFQLTEPGRLLTKKEVAELLRVSTRTVENMTNRGDLPKICLGIRTVRYPADGIRRFLDQHTVNPI
jgi:excisionase family DNA binding protein